MRSLVPEKDLNENLSQSLLPKLGGPCFCHTASAIRNKWEKPGLESCYGQERVSRNSKQGRISSTGKIHGDNWISLQEYKTEQNRRRAIPSEEDCSRQVVLLTAFVK